jgi:hypothetical protein
VKVDPLPAAAVVLDAADEVQTARIADGQYHWADRRATAVGDGGDPRLKAAFLVEIDQIAFTEGPAFLVIVYHIGGDGHRNGEIVTAVLVADAGEVRFLHGPVPAALRFEKRALAGARIGALRCVQASGWGLLAL